MKVEDFIKQNLRNRLLKDGFTGVQIDNGIMAGWDEMKRNGATFDSAYRTAKKVANASGRVR